MQSNHPIKAILLTGILSSLLGIGLITFQGCRSQKTPPPSEEATDQEKSDDSSADEEDTIAGEQESDTPNFQVPSSPEEKPSAKPPIEPMVGLTPKELLQSMVSTYQKANSYADHGYLQMQTEPVPSQGPLRLAYTVAYEKPNKIRMQIGYGILVSDGENRFGNSGQIPTQVLDLAAPAELTIADLFPDPLLAEVMDIPITPDSSWVPLQILFLFSEDPLKTLVPEGAELEMLSPEWLGDYPCERLGMTVDGQQHILWIDRHRRLLLRYEFPHEQIPPPPGVDSIKHVSAEMPQAQVNVEITPEAFQLAVLEGTRHVAQFEPKSVAMLGKQVEDISFLDLEGNPVPISHFDRKAIVLIFWTTKSPPCRTFLPEVFRIFKVFQNDGRIKIAGVSVDEPQVADQTLKNVLEDWGAPLTTYRVGENTEALQRFSLEAIPTVVLLDENKKIVLFHQGMLPGPILQERCKALLEGEDLIEQARNQFAELQSRFREVVEESIAQDNFSRAAGETEPYEVEILPKRMPEQLTVTELWENSALMAPGNILVLQDTSEPLRLVVPCEGNALAVLDTKGKVLRKIKPEGSEGKPITFVRQMRDSEGERLFAAAAMSGSQVFLLDERFQTVGTYPAKTIPQGQPRIADVRLTDLNGDGHPDLIIGYSGAGGLEAVSLEDPSEGKLLWKDESIFNAFRVEITSSATSREIMALNVTERSGNIVKFTLDGERTTTLEAPENQPIAWFAQDGMHGSGESQICALIPAEDAEAITAMGLTPSGSQLWSYPFPVGSHSQPIEQITSGDLVGDDAKEWILASADGTLHILDRHGETIDQFMTGEELAGIAVASWEGKKVLLVSDTNRLNAWEIGRQSPSSVETEEEDPVDLPPAVPPSEPEGTSETPAAPLVPIPPQEIIPEQEPKVIAPPTTLPGEEETEDSPPDPSEATEAPAPEATSS